MTCKGYTGLIIAVDQDDGELFGLVPGLRYHGVTFVGKTFEEARRCFEESVDFYLEGCARDGVPPEQPDPAVVAPSAARR